MSVLSGCFVKMCILTLLLFIAPSYVTSKEIKLATILPADESRLFSIRSIAPAIEIAIDNLKERPYLLQGYEFSVKYEDSGCDIAQGINQAIRFYMQEEVTAFLGPVCDYALAPIARQSRFWDIPVVTAGGMAMDFTKDKLKDYAYLTRVGLFNFVSLYQCFIGILRAHGWGKLKIIYDKTGQDSIFPGFCHLSTSAMHFGILAEAKKTIEQSFYRLDQASSMEQLLQEEVGHSSAGKLPFFHGQL